MFSDRGNRAVTQTVSNLWTPARSDTPAAPSLMLNLFTDTPASGAPQDGIANTDGYGDMQQSNLEQANVEVVTEISDLIAAQRAYEMNAKVISAADQMLQSTAALFR